MGAQARPHPGVSLPLMSAEGEQAMAIWILVICAYQGGCNMQEVNSKDACISAVQMFQIHRNDIPNTIHAFCFPKD
jgi:hypothetical protein